MRTEAGLLSSICQPGQELPLQGVPVNLHILPFVETIVFTAASRFMRGLLMEPPARVSTTETPVEINLEIVVPIGVPGLAEDNTAIAPVTWGVAMLVPSMLLKPPPGMED
jgi:hypothetical protein